MADPPPMYSLRASAGSAEPEAANGNNTRDTSEARANHRISFKPLDDSQLFECSVEKSWEAVGRASDSPRTRESQAAAPPFQAVTTQGAIKLAAASVARSTTKSGHTPMSTMSTSPMTRATAVAGASGSARVEPPSGASLYM